MKPYALMHKAGMDPCGGIAMYLDVKPETGVIASYKNACFPDGSVPQDADPFKCGTCGHKFRHWEADTLMNNFEEIEQ